MAEHPPYLRTLLRARTDWIEQRMLEGAARNGYGHLTPAMVRLFGHMSGRPLGISTLARRLAVSKQAVHQLATEGARLGLLEFVPSEQDGRVKLVRFTEKGWAMSDSASAELQRIEDELAATLGREDMAALRRILARPWPGDAPVDDGAPD